MVKANYFFEIVKIINYYLFFMRAKDQLVHLNLARDGYNISAQATAGFISKVRTVKDSAIHSLRPEPFPSMSRPIRRGKINDSKCIHAGHDGHEKEKTFATFFVEALATPKPPLGSIPLALVKANSDPRSVGPRLEEECSKTSSGHHANGSSSHLGGLEDVSQQHCQTSMCGHLQNRPTR